NAMRATDWFHGIAQLGARPSGSGAAESAQRNRLNRTGRASPITLRHVTPSQRLQSAYKLRQRLRGNAGLIRWDMKIKRLPVGFVAPAQPIKASRPLSGADWIHEIKHDGYPS